MVKDLKTANDSKNTGDKTISLGALGKAKNTGFGSKEKVPLLEPTLAKIKSIEIKMEDKYEHNRDAPEKIYHPGYVIFETEFEDPKTNEMVTSKDFFRGLRFYIALDDEQSPLKDEAGDEVIERLWIGDSSGLGKVRKVVTTHDSSINDYVKFFEFFEPGLEVKIKSFFNTNPTTGEQVIKQQIVEIV